MSVAKEAERKGDTEKLKRALSYASEMADQAEQYSEKTDEGMKLEAKEAKEQEELRQEELIKARKAEREEQENRIKEGEGNRKKPVSMWQKSAKKANIRWRWQTHHLRCLQSSHKM